MKREMIVNFDTRDLDVEELKGMLSILGFKNGTHGIEQRNENKHHIFFTKDRDSMFVEYKKLRMICEDLQLELEALRKAEEIKSDKAIKPTAKST